jgi:hypothetical protein
MDVNDIKTWARRVEKRAGEILDELEMSDDPCVEALQLEVEAVRASATECVDAAENAFNDDGGLSAELDEELEDW